MRLPKGNAHHVDPEWNEDEQAILKTPAARYTSPGASGALWRTSRIRRSQTVASLGSYENGGFVSRSVGREYPQRDS